MAERELIQTHDIEALRQETRTRVGVVLVGRDQTTRDAGYQLSDDFTLAFCRYMADASVTNLASLQASLSQRLSADMALARQAVVDVLRAKASELANVLVIP